MAKVGFWDGMHRTPSQLPKKDDVTYTFVAGQWVSYLAVHGLALAAIHSAFAYGGNWISGKNVHSPLLAQGQALGTIFIYTSIVEVRHLVTGESIRSETFVSISKWMTIIFSAFVASLSTHLVSKYWAHVPVKVLYTGGLAFLDLALIVGYEACR